MILTSRALRWHLLITDIGFLCYWLITALGILPAAWLFKDYDNPILVAWNWSFAPIDILASLLGLAALFAAKRQINRAHQLVLISLALTFCAGFMALAFWTLRQDFDLFWWLPNLYLTIWPLFFITRLVCPKAAELA